jgi:hypothetical protein
MGLINFFPKIQELYIPIVAVTLKVMPPPPSANDEVRKSEKPIFYKENKVFLENHTLQPFRQFQAHGCM